MWQLIHRCSLLLRSQLHQRCLLILRIFRTKLPSFLDIILTLAKFSYIIITVKQSYIRNRS
nr:MAG TPA: hypothetical protein [Caudoviricetes sp.]